MFVFLEIVLSFREKQPFRFNLQNQFSETNAGVPDRLFKRHGRWVSESAKDGYVQDSSSSRLSVSKALGI